MRVGRRLPFLAGVLALGLAFLPGCRSSPRASGPASLIVGNYFQGSCAAGHAKRIVITASVDQNPFVSIGDDAKFQFANLTPGQHSLTLNSVGAPFQGGHLAWTLRFSANPGDMATLQLDCAADGSVRVTGPSVH